MHCAECGQPLQEAGMGAYAVCHPTTHGQRYWYDQPPTADDVKTALQLGVLPRQHRQYWLYQHPLLWFKPATRPADGKQT